MNAGCLLRPVRVLDDVDEVGPLISRDEALQHVGFHVAERRFRLGGDAFGERLQDAALEVRTWVQGGDLGAVGVADVVVADAEHVVLDARRHQCDLWLHELRDTWRGVQGDGRPDPADAVLGHAVALQEPAGFVGAVQLEAPAAATELLVQAEIMEHRPDVEEFGVEAPASVATLHTAEPEDPAGMVVDQIGGGIAYQVCGIASQFGVGDRHPGRGLSAGGHRRLLVSRSTGPVERYSRSRTGGSWSAWRAAKSDYRLAGILSGLSERDVDPQDGAVARGAGDVQGAAEGF